MIPQAGDVLVSKPLASIEHEISIVPHASHLSCATHDLAVTAGCDLAKRLHVDAWLTEDHTHFLPLASYRDTRG